MALGPAVFDRQVLSLDVAGFAQPLAECGYKRCTRARRAGGEEADTGIAFCCARSTRGAAIAPPRRSMSSRRLIR
jgi:hypothetical protein